MSSICLRYGTTYERTNRTNSSNFPKSDLNFTLGILNGTRGPGTFLPGSSRVVRVKIDEGGGGERNYPCHQKETKKFFSSRKNRVPGTLSWKRLKTYTIKEEQKFTLGGSLG